MKMDRKKDVIYMAYIDFTQKKFDKFKKLNDCLRYFIKKTENVYYWNNPYTVCFAILWLYKGIERYESIFKSSLRNDSKDYLEFAKNGYISYIFACYNCLEIELMKTENEMKNHLFNLKSKASAMFDHVESGKIMAEFSVFDADVNKLLKIDLSTEGKRAEYESYTYEYMKELDELNKTNHNSIGKKLPWYKRFAKRFAKWAKKTAGRAFRDKDPETSHIKNFFDSGWKGR